MSTSRSRYFLTLALGAGLLLAPTGALHAQQSVTCASCLVVDERGAVLYARAARTPRANASTTKIVTALAVREHAGLDESVTVSGPAAATAGGRLSLEAGERWTVEELLVALLLPSSNDAAVALAEHVAGSERAFLPLMEEVAQEAGAASMSFQTAHGLDQPGHAASAADLAAVGAALLEDPVLSRIVGEPRLVITSSTRTVKVENTNLLLESYAPAIGIKTGYTMDAGNVLVAAAERDGRRLISVAMGSVDAFADSRILLTRGFAKLRRTVLLARSTRVGELVFGGAGTVPLETTASVRGMERADLLSRTLVLDDEVELPLSAGQEVGHIVVASPTAVVAEVPVVASGGIAGDRPGPVADALMGILRFSARILEDR